MNKIKYIHYIYFKNDWLGQAVQSRECTAVQLLVNKCKIVKTIIFSSLLLHI